MTKNTNHHRKFFDVPAVPRANAPGARRPLPYCSGLRECGRRLEQLRRGIIRR